MMIRTTWISPCDVDNLTTEQRKKNMQHIRSVGTLPERIVMQALRKQRIYFAAHVSRLPGKPDIVFRRKRIVVFIDSDFWHGHPNRFRLPATNRDYWREKIEGNKVRDRLVNKELRKRGWTVMRLWEYDIKHRLEVTMMKVLNKVDGA
mgnify:CR=1 FL=1